MHLLHQEKSARTAFLLESCGWKSVPAGVRRFKSCPRHLKESTWNRRTVLKEGIAGLICGDILRETYSKSDAPLVAGKTPVQVRTGINDSLPINILEAYNNSPTSYKSERIEQELSYTLEELRGLDVEIQYHRIEISSKKKYRRLIEDVEMTADSLGELERSTDLIKDEVSEKVLKRITQNPSSNLLIGEFNSGYETENELMGRHGIGLRTGKWSFLKKKDDFYFIHNMGGEEIGHTLGLGGSKFPNPTSGAIFPDIMTESWVKNPTGYWIDRLHRFGPASLSQWEEIREKVLEP